MPGFLSIYNTPKRIEVADGYWIDVKTSLTAEDYEHAQRALLGKMTMSGDGLQSEPDTVGYQSELVARSIVGWNLTDEEGVLLPLTPDDDKKASVMRLPQEIFLMLFDLVNETSGARSTEEEVNFRADGQGSDHGNG
jgi:hypothetical protein